MTPALYSWTDETGRHFKVVPDTYHETRGSYAYDTEEETRKAEDEELSKLASGDWVVVGIIQTEHACEDCSHVVDSIWGNVGPDSLTDFKAYAQESF